MQSDPFDHMHQLLGGYVTRGEIPGLVALVARGDDVHVDVTGSMAIGGPPMPRDAIFRIASMTKPIVAAGVMALIEDGKLALDEPVDHFLPELANRRVLRRVDSELDDTVPAERAIIVRDLLAYTLGYGILMLPPRTYPIQRATEALQLSQGIPGPQTAPPPDEWMRRFGTLPLMYQPGARWVYSTGSDLQAVLVARVSGRPLEDYLRERILDPLGMTDTGFAVPARNLDRLATSYVVDLKNNGLVLFDSPDGQWSTPPAFPSGAGGMISTADDFLAFAQMMQGRGARGAVRVLTERSVDQMTSGQLTPAQRTASNDFANYFVEHTYGFGVGIVTGHDDAGSPGTIGWDGGLGTTWRSDPTSHTITILLTQRSMTSPEPPPVFRDFWRSAAEAFATSVR
jgi:CubicO group peptidase (beta-lactamase class C family)